LQCEYRLRHPVIALIMLGTNDIKVKDKDLYQSQMEMIIEQTIELGIVPIISTIPLYRDYPVETREYNELIVSLAQSNQIPLWDYAASMENLPNSGLGSDGVHPSLAPDAATSLNSAYMEAEYLQYGYNMRNLTGLMMLHLVWQSIKS
jgi:lysophospholipase L1-like esterase